MDNFPLAEYLGSDFSDSSFCVLGDGQLHLIDTEFSEQNRLCDIWAYASFNYNFYQIEIHKFFFIY